MGYWLFWREWEYMMPEILDWVRTANLGEFLKVLTWRKCVEKMRTALSGSGRMGRLPACRGAAVLSDTAALEKLRQCAKELSRLRGAAGSATSGLRGGRILCSGTTMAPTGSCARTSRMGHTLRGCERCV